MWGSSPVDQADAYGRNLLAKNKLTGVEKFNLLRSIQITVAWIKTNMKPKTSKEELETLTLSFYIERVELDIKTHSGGVVRYAAHRSRIPRSSSEFCTTTHHQHRSSQIESVDDRR
jgi:hypothetical protein